MKRTINEDEPPDDEDWRAMLVEFEKDADLMSAMDPTAPKETLPTNEPGCAYNENGDVAVLIIFKPHGAQAIEDAVYHVLEHGLCPTAISRAAALLEGTALAMAHMFSVINEQEDD